MLTAQRTTMHAMVYHAYGSPDRLALQEVAQPTIKEDDVLVRIRAAGVDPGVWFTLLGQPLIVRPMTGGLFRPRQTILGRALAGQVEAVGRAVTQFQPGEEVYGEIDGGAYAEYAAVPAALLARKPVNLTFEQAAAVPLSAVTALQGLRDAGQIKAGHRVLINGASGGVGTFAVQIARSFGAEVTGVCSPRNSDLVRSIGADKVIDYTREDFTRGGARYDLILDLIGNHSLSDCRRALTPTGRLVLSSGPPSPVFRRIIVALLLSPFMSQKMVPFLQQMSAQDLAALKNLIETGAVTPIIDRTYPLSELPAALHYQGEGHAQGKTIITI